MLESPDMGLLQGLPGYLVATMLFTACNDSKQMDGGTHADAGAPAVNQETPDPFTGDCSSARWASVSDKCWSCFCNTCKDSLNACNLDCVKGIACANENHTQVGVAADVSCEIRAFTATCLKDAAAQAVAGQLVAFDACLINAHTPAEHLRACEEECGFVYTNDVCQRFPAPDGG